MAKLNEEFFDKIAAKVIKEGEPDDLAKFMLSGEEHIAAVQRYFYDLEADKKKVLTLKGDEWFLGLDGFRNDYDNAHTGLPLFKLVAPSIIPFVQKLHIINTQLDDYSFLREIKSNYIICHTTASYIVLDLYRLKLQFTTEEYIKILSALSNLRSVDYLLLDIKGLTLQWLCFLPFSFHRLYAKHFIFETDPKCDKLFQSNEITLYGDKELKNDFVFTRQNYENYAAIFPNASTLRFEFYIKIFDDISDLLKVSNADHYEEAKVATRNIEIKYRFFDYSGYPDSKVLKMVQDDERWDTQGCPHMEASTVNIVIVVNLLENNDVASYKSRHVSVTCNFPLVGPEVGSILAEQSLRRIPEDSTGSPEDYYRLTIENDWGHKTEFEVLKTASIGSLIKAYGDLTGMNSERLYFEVDDSWFYFGPVADNFKDGDVILITFDDDF